MKVYQVKLSKDGAEDEVYRSIRVLAESAGDALVKAEEFVKDDYSADPAQADGVVVSAVEYLLAVDWPQL